MAKRPFGKHVGSGPVATVLALLLWSGAGMAYDEDPDEALRNTRPIRYWLHASGGVTGCVYLHLPSSSLSTFSAAPIVGIVALPEGRLSLTLDDDDLFRVFGSLRWSGLKELTLSRTLGDEPVAGRSTDTLEIVAAIGASFKVAQDGGAVPISSQIDRVSIANCRRDT